MTFKFFTNVKLLCLKVRSILHPHIFCSPRVVNCNSIVADNCILHKSPFHVTLTAHHSHDFCPWDLIRPSRNTVRRQSSSWTFSSRNILDSFSVRIGKSMSILLNMNQTGAIAIVMNVIHYLILFWCLASKSQSERSEWEADLYYVGNGKKTMTSERTKRCWSRNDKHFTQVLMATTAPPMGSKNMAFICLWRERRARTQPGRTRRAVQSPALCWAEAATATASDDMTAQGAEKVHSFQLWRDLKLIEGYSTSKPFKYVYRRGADSKSSDSMLLSNWNRTRLVIVSATLFSVAAQSVALAMLTLITQKKPPPLQPSPICPLTTMRAIPFWTQFGWALSSYGHSRLIRVIANCE